VEVGRPAAGIRGRHKSGQGSVKLLETTHEQIMCPCGACCQHMVVAQTPMFHSLRSGFHEFLAVVADSAVWIHSGSAYA
jgi:hypothetical protein